MHFKRPQSNSRIAEEDRQALLKAYFAHYGQMWQQEPAALNRKLPREFFRELLDEIGSKLLSQAREVAGVRFVVPSRAEWSR